MPQKTKKIRRNRRAIAVADVVGEVLDARPLKMRLLHEDIFRQWRKIVGKGLIDKCRPRRIKGHTLHLDVASSSWAHQLIYLQEEIISRVNKLAGTLLIASIHCRAVKRGELEIVEAAVKPAADILPDNLISEVEKQNWRSEIEKIVKDPELCELLGRMRCHSETRRRVREKM